MGDRLIRWLLCCSLILAGAATLPAGSDRSGEGGRDRPNVLIIVTDDQRHDAMSVMGSTRRLFGEGGTRFRNAYATTPLCCPSRGTIFTGRYAHNHGIKGDWLDLGSAGEQAAFQQSTIQRYLEQAGYVTGIYGKYLNQWDIAQAPPFFDNWAIQEEEAYTNGTWNVQGRTERVTTYSTTFIRRKAREFLAQIAESRDARPWFLYVAPIAPHDPFDPEERYADAEVPLFAPPPSFREEDRSDKPEYVQRAAADAGHMESARANQLRTLMSVDDLVRTIFRTIRELNERNTLAIFISDNGYMNGEHHLRKKYVPYSSSIRVPLFMRWPGYVRPGTTQEKIVGNLDVAPTVLDAANLRADHEIDGRSLLQRWTRDEILTEYFRYNGWGSWASLRSRSFQYVEYYEERGDSADHVTFREYYDLEEDPWQLENRLADGEPANDPDVQALSIRLAKARSCTGASCP